MSDNNPDSNASPAKIPNQSFKKTPLELSAKLSLKKCPKQFLNDFENFTSNVRLVGTSDKGRTSKEIPFDAKNELLCIETSVEY